MRRLNRLGGSLAVVGVASLVLAACGADEPETSSSDPLVLGRIAAETGDLAALGPPVIQGVNMAVDDINAAGGVNGQDVILESGDEGGDASVVRDTSTRMVNAGVQGVVGAMASGMSLEVVQTLAENRVAQCSASNTSPAFSKGIDAEGNAFNNSFYHRTIPPDAAVAPVIANQVIAAGATKAAVVVRADDYGVQLGRLVADELKGQIDVTGPVEYNPDTTDFSSEVSKVTEAEPDAVVVISFGEGAGLIRQMIEQGIESDQIYGGDGLFGPNLAASVDENDPGAVAGLTVVGAAGGVGFNENLDKRLNKANKGNYIYGGQAYDCTVVLALAAIDAESVAGTDINAEIEGVTEDGTKCEKFAECKALLEEGEDIDYDGVSGPLEIEGADPTWGRYAIAQFQDDGSLEVIDDQDVELAELGL